MLTFFLSSGLFLGWSLGANDAANVFGTAVGSKMIRFRTAAVCCSIFVTLGAVVSGSGTTETLGKLGSVNAVAGAFIVAFAAALSVYLMTKARYPVSTSQAIVGAILGWNLFSGSQTDLDSLRSIVMTWVACPALAAVFAVALYKFSAAFIKKARIHMFLQDSMTRYGLYLAGIFGSYSLGANNIANVMGVFVPVSPFREISFFGLFSLTAAQQLFFLGGVAISVGVFTYSHRVMHTVGAGIIELTPLAAFVVVLAHSMVLFVFASTALQNFLIAHGIPPVPLVPVSSSQAIVGAIIGIGILRGGKGIRYRLLGGIAGGWALTPVVSALVCFISLFFLQNVFQQEVYRNADFFLSEDAIGQFQSAGIPAESCLDLKGKQYYSASELMDALSADSDLTQEQCEAVVSLAEVYPIVVTAAGIAKAEASGRLNERQIGALKLLEGRRYVHAWQFDADLAQTSSEWNFDPGGESRNAVLRNKLEYLHTLFKRKR